jgi:DNA-binding transcriptional ArsR family regulator
MFEKVLRRLDVIEARISAMSQEIKAPRGPTHPVYLSVGLQTTVNTLKALTEPASADQISAITGRARAVESGYLNELFRMGLARKERRGRIGVFTLKEK